MVFDSKQMASKFLDGDLKSKNDLEQLIGDKKTKQTYSRYQLVSHLMRNEAVAPDVCIADSVMSALSQEATVLAPRGDKTPQSEQSGNVISMPARFGKQIGGMAIAASVALVALLNFGTQTIEQTPIQTLAATEIQAPAVDRAQLQQAHQLFTELSQAQNLGLPNIQTVSNQQAVAVTVPTQAEAEDAAKKEAEKQIITPKQTQDK
ncbi:MAG: hypothetical protein HWE16_03250 [Gammaproteobacteria bacterium]|nr:hypothetical protein [Gammaproteobacteria bacterium]